jgi:hypothetical protein
LEMHNSFFYTINNSSSCRRNCGFCWHWAAVAHAWTPWASLGLTNCARGCNRCGYSTVQEHDLVIIASGTTGALLRCRRCNQSVHW